MALTGIIAQARMTSKRLPGKVLMKLDGKPVLHHVMERAKLIKGADVIICAYPEKQDEIGDLARSLGCEAFAGPEHDVLKRYWLAALKFELDVIVRVTCDCALLHPGVSADVIKLRDREGVDYASNLYPERTFPKGFDTEVFTWDALDYAHSYTWDPLDANSFAVDDYDREHVTPLLQSDDKISKALLRQPVDESEVNYCVDEPGDIERIEKLMHAWKQVSLRELESAASH